MTLNSLNGSPQEQKKVSLESPKDVEYWTYKLHCNEAELKDAIESVGNDPGKILEYLHLVRGERDE